MLEIEQMCAGVRRALEPGMPKFGEGRPNSTGTCLYAAFLLRFALEKFDKCSSVIRGGDGCGDGGALDSGGHWRGHYWVEAERPDGVRFVADITADQFGYAPVVVLSYKDADVRYQPGYQLVVDAAVEDLAGSLISCDQPRSSGREGCQCAGAG